MSAQLFSPVERRAIVTAAFAIAAMASISAAPQAPTNLTVQISGSNVVFTWTAPPGGVIGYVLEAGSASGLSDQARAPLGPATTFGVSGVPDGTYFVRVRAVDASGEGPASNEVVVTVAAGTCMAPPNVPFGLTSSVNGTLVGLAWHDGGGCPATNFALHVGSASGLSNLALANLGAATSFAASAPPGTYFVRVVAQNAFGSSAPSNEVVVTVGSGVCAAPPAAPVGLTSAVSGTLVNLAWHAGAGCPATSFVLLAGTASGLSNAATANVGAATSLSTSAPPGTYYVRVVAQNAFGTSAPSNEIVVTVAAVVPNLTGTWLLTRTGTAPWITQFSTFALTLVQSGTMLSGSIRPTNRTTATPLNAVSRILPDGRIFFGSESPGNYWNDFSDAYFTLTLAPSGTTMTGTCNNSFTCTSATATRIQ